MQTKQLGRRGGFAIALPATPSQVWRGHSLHKHFCDRPWQFRRQVCRRTATKELASAVQWQLPGQSQLSRTHSAGSSPHAKRRPSWVASSASSWHRFLFRDFSCVPNRASCKVLVTSKGRDWAANAVQNNTCKCLHHTGVHYFAEKCVSKFCFFCGTQAERDHRRRYKHRTGAHVSMP